MTEKVLKRIDASFGYIWILPPIRFWVES